MKPLDKKDLILLSELLKDGRVSYSELAEKISLSVPATTSRIEKLIENGIIEKFTINVDYSLISEGKPKFIGIKVPQKEMKEFSKKLYQQHFVRNIFLTTGTFNLIVLTQHLTSKEEEKMLEYFDEESKIINLEVLNIYDKFAERDELNITDPANAKLICDYCKREFQGQIFSKVIGNKKRYFCCNTCLTEFEKRF